MLVDRANLEAGVRARLEAELAPLRMLDQVVRWAFAQTPARDVAEVVVQDEFTHDVVIPWDAGRWLVFGTT